MSCSPGRHFWSRKTSSRASTPFRRSARTFDQPVPARLTGQCRIRASIGGDSRIDPVKSLLAPAEAAAAARSRELPPAVVVDVNWVNGLAAVRSLGRAGGAGGRRRPPHLGARPPIALRAPGPVPDPGADEEGFVSLLSELGDALGRPAAVFPTHDESLNAVARAPVSGWATASATRSRCGRPLARIQSKRAQL